MGEYEQLLNNRQERAELTRQANTRLKIAVTAIGRVASEIIRLDEVPEHARLAAKHYAGSAIKFLVQEHLTTYMTGPTSMRGLGVDIGVGPYIVLETESGELYDVIRSQRTVNSTVPLPEREWFINRQGILANVTSSKFY